ncbi:predicted protein [Pyrenophora tritici-repentis Pt-1C-BFP]|uniref:Uncharacterized protein n=1 Tax=Pyrenophora tritici-repentis (strain Pt-1C-BFP) TaxID=426418 RepID=B2W5E5_PYRTR|nr:uncharacterized protein PTRG_04845 [Pyrenophora tritici-repentis Pt-1C-BFP]EDU47752.1 predicted protein [Pyrenophora tritici-repentis Pt-1C-BFP]
MLDGGILYLPANYLGFESAKVFNVHLSVSYLSFSSIQIKHFPKSQQHLSVPILIMLPQSLGLFAFSAFAAVAQGASVSLDARQGLKLAWIKGGDKPAGRLIGPICEEIRDTVDCLCSSGRSGLWLARSEAIQRVSSAAVIRDSEQGMARKPSYNYPGPQNPEYTWLHLRLRLCW